MLAGKALAAAVSQAPIYIEDVFSTDLFTGQTTATTVVNGIDLATKGGMVWTKSRTSADANYINYTDSGAPTYVLRTNTNGALGNESSSVSAFNTNGFTGWPFWNPNNLVSWTFRKQPKFFDVVTVTGQATQTTFNHNLGSVPGCIIIKCTNSTGDWFVYHRSTGSSQYLVLNNTSAQAAYTNWCVATSTTVTVLSGVMGNANSFVVYLFAHDAGGFGLEGTDNVISCGSYVGNGSTTAAGAVDINLGWEPQWILVKSATSTGGDANWSVLDTMRGYGAINSTGNKALYANTSGAEQSNDFYGYTTSTGFKMWETNVANNGTTYIYIAIRRGPMKVPTSGTEVFTPLTYTGSSTQGTLRNAGFTVDAVFSLNRSNETNKSVYDRLRGAARILLTTQTDAEVAQTGAAIGLFSFANNVGYLAGEDQSSATINFDPRTYVNYFFRRAPGFFDVVCYTGTGSALTQPHNLAAVPELMIVKGRSQADAWWTYHSTLGNTQAVALQTANAASTSINFWNNTTPTTTQFTVGPSSSAAGVTKVAYLFATVAGVSKVGSYTSNGATQTINCGFTAGARFVMIKRTDSTGDWYVWDTARGIVTTNDPYLLLNSTAAEVTNTDFIDPDTTGFIVSQAGSATINVNGGTYIFLAIA